MSPISSIKSAWNLIFNLLWTYATNDLWTLAQRRDWCLLIISKNLYSSHQHGWCQHPGKKIHCAVSVLFFSTDMKCNNFIESIASWTGRRKGHHETLDTPVCCGNSEALVKIYVCAWKRISLKSSPMMFRIENTLQINVIFHL